MPSFDVSGVVEGLECKLKPYADFEGIIPEPSDQQIGAFIAALKIVLQESRAKAGKTDEVDVSDPEQVAAALAELNSGGAKEFTDDADRAAGIYADLCSGTPSKAQILAVPPRARTIFYQWLQKEVLSPEAVTPAGKAQVKLLPQRASA